MNTPLIVILDELSDVLMEKRPKSVDPFCLFDRSLAISEHSTYDNDVKQQLYLDPYFLSISNNLKVFQNIEMCHQYISENSKERQIFLIILGSTKAQVLSYFVEADFPVYKIYLVNQSDSKTIEDNEAFTDRDNQVYVFDSSEELICNLSKSIHQYYQSEVRHENSCSLFESNWRPVFSKLIKMMNVKSIESKSDEEMNKTKTKLVSSQFIYTNEFTNTGCSVIHRENSISLVLVSIIGDNFQLPDLISNVAKVIYFENFDTPGFDMKILDPVIIVSNFRPTNTILSLTGLLYYYYYATSETVEDELQNNSKVICYDSVSYIVSDLYQNLGQYYRGVALQMYYNPQDQEKSRRMLQLSTECYDLLKKESEKVLQHYADLLKHK